MSKFALLFVLTYLSGLLAVVTIGPAWGIYLYELVYFLNPGTRWWSASLPSISYSFVIVVSIVISFFYRRNKFNINTLQNMPQAKWFALLFLVYCLVYFVSVSPEYHKKFLYDLFKLYIIMYLAFRILDSEFKIEYAIYAYLIGSAYIGYEAYLVGRNEFGRVEGIGTVDSPNANGVAAAIAPAVPMLIYFFWRKKIVTKLFVGFLGLFIVNGLILINSRGAFLASFVGFAYLISIVAFSKYQLPKQRFMVVFLLVGSLAVGLYLTDNVFWERMATLETQSSKEDIDASGGRRINFWLATFDMLEDNPMGLGIYGYQILSPSYLDESLLDQFGKGEARAVHSLWFQSLSEVGWLGFVIFLTLLFSIYRYSNRAKKRAIELNLVEQYYLIVAIEASLLSFMVAGSFLDVFRSEIFYWLMMFNIAMSSVILSSDETKRHANANIPDK